MDQKFYKELGQRLRIIRNSKKLSLDKMSEQLSISYQQLQKYESGINRVPLDKLMKICNLCDISMMEMFTFKYPHLVKIPSKNAKTSDLYNPNAEVLELIQIYNGLPRHIQISFLKLLKTLSETK